MNADAMRRGVGADFAGQARHIVPRQPAPAVACEHRDLTAAVREVLVAAGVLNACVTAMLVGGTKVRVTIEGFINPDRRFQHAEYFPVATAHVDAIDWSRMVLTTREGLT